MLKTLTVWNFALLEHVQVEFGAGLNILTGETGAGKSILIDALGGILGQRLSGDMIRTGCDWLRIEAVFSFGNMPDELKEFLESQAVDTEEGQVIVTRQLNRGGRGIVLVNGCHLTLAVLKQLGTLLVDIHGQNENLALLKEANQFNLVDSFLPEVQESLADYGKSYTAWHDCQQKCKAKEQAARENAQRLDMLRWQDKEISEAQLREGEDEELEAEIRKLSHAEKIANHAEEAYGLFEGGGKSGLGILSAVSLVKKHLADISRYDDSLANAQTIVEEAEISLQEAAYELRDYGESLDYSPARLDKLQTRMDLIDKLCRKYGVTVADVLAHQKKVQQELAEIENYDDDMAALKEQMAKLHGEMEQKAAILTKWRQRSAEALSGAIGEQLLSLGMPKAVFRVEIGRSGKFAASGADTVSMFFSANPGEAEKPLQKVASGGELSRIALAIKAVAASRDRAIGSMVFDEIDTGIGGRTAQMVAERIALVANFKQVLCITHLPQIACMADQHLYIAKSSVGQSTVTQVRPLSEHERVREIARMASGADLTTASLDNAREMVSHARMKKQQFAHTA